MEMMASFVISLPLHSGKQDKEPGMNVQLFGT